MRRGRKVVDWRADGLAGAIGRLDKLNGLPAAAVVELATIRDAIRRAIVWTAKGWAMRRLNDPP